MTGLGLPGEENAEELSLKRAGKAAFSHPGTGGFGLGGWGEPTSYPCGGPYQAVPGGVFRDITAQADRSGYIRGIRHGAGFRR